MKEKCIANIVCLNSQYVHSSLAPWCLLAGVKVYASEWVEAFVCEGTVNEGEDALLERICRKPWDVIGFCCYIWNVSLVKGLCRKLKERYPHRSIVLGGPEVGYTPEETLAECPQADFVLTGAGERSFALLCKALALDEAVAVAGCSSRQGSLPPEELRDPPSPYTEEYFAALQGRMAYLETMRGCPYSCAFCLSGQKEAMVFFPMERVKQELLLLANSGTKTIKLVDRSFNADPKRALEIVDFLLGHRFCFPEELCIHFEIEGMTLTEELADRFCSAPAGFFRLEIGVQSCNPQTLASVHRHNGGEKLLALIGKLANSGVLTVHADLIAGLPHEDLQSLRDSFNRLYEAKPHEIQLGFLKVLKGTPMRDGEHFPMEYSPLPPYEVKQTPWLNREDLLRLQEMAQTVEKLYNSGKYLLTLQQAISLFDSPFDFYFAFSRFCQGADHRQDTYTDRLFLFCMEHGMAEAKVRDLLVQDRLASCAVNLSPELKRREKEKQKPKKQLQKKLGSPVGRRGAALLWEKKQIVFCDYDGGPFCQKDPIRGRYRLFYEEV